MTKKTNILLIWITCLALTAGGNNLSVTNGSINGKTISMDVAWDNAWNLKLEGGNHDAIWIFAKGKTATGSWVHINVENSNGTFYASSPLEIKPSDDGKGVFVLLADGVANVSATSIAIETSVDLSIYREVRVYGIEMVHVPQGKFHMGDGASISSIANASGDPILIESEAGLSTTNLTLHNANTEFTPQLLPSSIPAEFPKGFASFYIMKYEVSQVQYSDFLNTLTYAQQASRTWRSPSLPTGTFAMVNPYQTDSLYRNGVAIAEPGVSPNKPAVYAVNYNKNREFNDESDGTHRAANFLSWGDLSAYLDWAALRPITEMEFEKACRGSHTPVKGEFAWGSSQVTNANTPTNDGTVFEAASEVPQPERGLANHGTQIATEGWGLRGVLRTGFAAKANTTRIEAGATLYGAMEMSGNVWEQTVMVAGGGESYAGNFGDGELAENGNANQPTWCNPTTAQGVLLKGGAWGSTIGEVGSWRDLAVSDRFYSHLKPSLRRNSQGGRGAR